jgi:hypothetical protein
MIGAYDRCTAWCQPFDSKEASYLVGCLKPMGHKGKKHTNTQKDKYGHVITFTWTDGK